MLLNVPEAAERAKVSETLIRRWTTVEKRLPHFRLGGRGKRADCVQVYAAEELGIVGEPARWDAEASQFIPDVLVHEVRFGRSWERDARAGQRNSAHRNVPEVAHQDRGFAGVFAGLDPAAFIDHRDVRRIRFEFGFGRDAATATGCWLFRCSPRTRATPG